MKLLVNGLAQGVGDRPAKLKSRNDSSIRYPRDLRPFCHGHGLSPQCDEATSSHISGLIFSSRPTAVVGRVAFLVVNALKGVLRRRARTHVFQKRCEAIFPAGADQNVAGSVVVVVGILGIVATLNHTLPSIVLGTVAHSVFDDAKVKPAGLSLKAAAAFRISAMQIALSNGHGVSAGAAAQPSDGFEFPSYRLQHCKPSELLVGEISKTHVAILPQEARP